LPNRSVDRNTRRTLCNVKTEALFEALAARLGEDWAKTLSDTLGKVKVEALVNNLADWPTELMPETLSEFWSI